MTTNYFVGIDCSSKAIHIVILNAAGNFVLSKKLESKAGDMDARFYDLSDIFSSWCKSYLSDMNDTIVMVETPIHVSNIKTTVSLSQMIGMVKYFAHTCGLVFPLDNHAWKKVVLGNGKASKELIMQFAEQKWGKENFLEQDFADAACIALWGVIRIAQTEKL